MPSDPVSAGRKGGQSRSAAKIATCRRNGFQKVKGTPETRSAPTPTTAPTITPDVVRCGTKPASVLTATPTEETK